MSRALKWLLAAALVLCPASVSAQVRVVGKVVTDTEAPLEGATITFRSAAVPAKRSRTVSGASGSFSVDLEGTGDYLIDAEATGFFTLENWPVSVGSTTGPELKLVLNPIKEVTESVTVSGRANPVGVEQNGAQKTLSGADLVNLPYADSESLKSGLRALPGVVEDSFAGIHVNGAREQETLFLLDGFNIGDPLSGGFDPPTSVEAVRSLNVLSGAYSAEYGKGGGGVVEVVTNTGDDTLRASGTHFFPELSYQTRLHIQNWSPRFNLSGPISRGRAWFSDNLIPEYSESIVPDLPNGQDTSTTKRFNNYFHSQINLSPTHFLYAGILGSFGSTDRSGLSALDPPPTTLDVSSHQVFAHVRDERYLSTGMVIDVGYASNRTYLRQQPQGTSAYVLTPSGRSGNNYLDTLQRSSRDQIIGNVSLAPVQFAGPHRVKLGVDLDHLSYEQDFRRGDLIFQDALQNPIRTIHFTGSGQLAVSNDEFAGWVQDVWSVRPELSLQLGVRTDWDRLIRDWTISPRLSVAWSPFGSTDTKLSAGYAVTHNATRLQLFAVAADQTPLSTVYPPYGAGQQAYPSTFVIPPHLASPAYRTWNVTMDRRLPANVYLRLQGLTRRTDNGLVYAGTPQIDAPSLYGLANTRTESYDSAEVSVRGNFGPEYSWLASYTRSSTRSNAVLNPMPDDYFVAPNNIGPLSWDTPNRVILWAYLPTFRKKWAWATLLDYRTGFPFSAANNAGTIVGPVDSYRFPAYLEWNVDLERRLRFHGQMWALRIGLNNITDHFNPDSVNGTVESSQFMQFYGGQRRALVFRTRWLGRQ